MSNGHTPSGLARAAATAPGGYSTYRPRLPWTWWTRNSHYTTYMLREMSSLFIAIWAWRFLRQLRQLRRGAAAYEGYVRRERGAGWLLFNLIAFLFAVLHSITFLQAAGMGPRVRVGGRKLSEATITNGAFAGWAAASVVVLLGLLLGGLGKDASVVEVMEEDA